MTSVLEDQSALVGRLCSTRSLTGAEKVVVSKLSEARQSRGALKDLVLRFFLVFLVIFGLTKIPILGNMFYFF